MSSEQMERELLELAAKAAGIAGEYEQRLTGVGIARAGQSCRLWNPLTDDGDALRLAVKLGISIDLHDCCAWKRLPNHSLIQDFWGGGYPDSYKHAIVRTAAQLAKGAEKV